MAGREDSAPPSDPVAAMILDELARPEAGRSLSPEAVARAIAGARARPQDPPDLWRRYLSAVRQQALHLARQGRIRILRKGKAVDPHAPVKGVIRLARPVAEDDIAVIPAAPEHFDAVSALIGAGPAAFFEAGFTAEGRQVFLDFVSPPALAARHAGGAEAYAAREGGDIVGYIETRPPRHVTLLFVRADRQGLGIAGRLLDRAIQDLGAGPVTVHASPAAIPAYERLGFMASGPTETKNGITFQPMTKP